MPTVQRTRTIAATPGELWDVLGDPHHLPRWWPRVQRVEAVGDDAFTQVLMSEKGKMVRADFKLLDAVVERRVVWAQQVQGTPFERVLKSAETEIVLADQPAEHTARGADSAAVSDRPATVVTIELRQELQGFRGSGALSLRLTGIASFGSPLVRRAAHTTIEEALDGLQRIVGWGSE
jgi:uncharacterized protein YndB with AHSA1/START domain